MLVPHCPFNGMPFAYALKTGGAMCFAVICQFVCPAQYIATYWFPPTASSKLCAAEHLWMSNESSRELPRSMPPVSTPLFGHAWLLTCVMSWESSDQLDLEWQEDLGDQELSNKKTWFCGAGRERKWEDPWTGSLSSRVLSIATSLNFFDSFLPPAGCDPTQHLVAKYPFAWSWCLYEEWKQ